MCGKALGDSLTGSMALQFDSAERLTGGTRRDVERESCDVDLRQDACEFPNPELFVMSFQ
jgi:hypothetical protein